MSLARSRKPGPLGQVQTEADALKIKIQELVGISSKFTHNTAYTPQVISCYKDCLKYQEEVKSLLEKANDLKLHDEPNLPVNFDQKKLDEIKRLQSLQQKLNQQQEEMEKLPNSEVLKILRRAQQKDESPRKSLVERELDSDEEDGVSDDEEYDDDEEADLYIAIHAYTAQAKGDLSVKANEVLDIIKKQDDGWWEAENEDGDRGMVPSNFLRVYTEEDDEDEPEKKEAETEKEEKQQSNVEEKKQQSKVEEKKSAAADSAPQSSPDERFSSKLLWKSIKESVVEQPKLDVTDVLGAMGALPAGFRPSMLAKLQEGTDRYSLQSAILPKLAESKLAYKDLCWDSATSNVRPIPTRVLRTFRMWKCVQIPLPGTGVEVLSRHVRYALFDGSQILSNIGIVRGHVQPNKEKMWMFSTKSKDGGLLSSLLRADGIARTNNVHSNLGILFELGVTYVRNPPKRVVCYSDGVACEYSDDDEDNETRNRIRQTGEKGELSCGWCHLKFFDEQGNRVPNRTYELSVNGGTPFERGVALDPTIMRRATSSKFRALMAASKVPRMFVQLGEPVAVKRKYLELLPPTVVIPSSYGRMLSHFRGVLAEALLCNRANASDASVIHSPVVTAFLGVANHFDIMDSILNNWVEKEKLMTKGEKKDEVFLITVFKKVVMETAYPMLHMNSLPEPRWANSQSEEARSRFVHQMALSTRQEKDVLKHFLTSNTDMEPFDISELTFDPLRHAARVM